MSDVTCVFSDGVRLFLCLCSDVARDFLQFLQVNAANFLEVRRQPLPYTCLQVVIQNRCIILR
jgi:hypothetical protein